LKRLYDRRDELLATLQAEYRRAKAARDDRAQEADHHEHRAALAERK
jgi:hypothetical protein